MYINDQCALVSSVGVFLQMHLGPENVVYLSAKGYGRHAIRIQLVSSLNYITSHNIR